jgi:hypothetical protein
MMWGILKYVMLSSLFEAPFAKTKFFLPNTVDGSWNGLGIRGTQVKSSIQDIVDEVAPIKKHPPPMGLRADSFECDVTRLFRGL